MAVPVTVDEFIDLVRKSGVVDEKKLDAYLAKMRADMPSDASKAAGLLIRNGILTNFQAENILAGKWRRFSIGKYKVLERLGSGGFAQVYLCEHKLMRRRVAVKVLPVAKTKDSSALARFHREARAAAALDHPNIVHAYDIDQDEDLHFLVMEYVDGANLQEIVRKSGAISVVRACHYIHDAALALQHAHEHGLVHRDIKPGNILVDRTGVVKLLDLGLALSFAEEDDQLTKKHDDGTLGTADYLSPEQAMDSHDVDIRTDIYSLGVTFYFLLTGRAPFEGFPIAQKLLAHQMKQPKPVADYRKDAPAEVLAILDKMMAKRADGRYATPGDLADALGPFTETPIAPPSDSEMPTLCPAVTGESETTVGKHDTPTTPARSSGSGSGRRVPAASGSAQSKPTAAVAEPEPEIAPWEQYAADTDNLAKNDTAPTSGHGSAKHKRPPIASSANSMVVIALVLAFVVVPIILTVAIGSVIYFMAPQTEPPAKTGPPKLEVSRDPTRKNSYTSIQSALRSAEIGSVIELWDATYEENVIVEPNRGRTSITLQAAPGREIIWRTGRNDPSQPILTLSKAGEFKLKGVGIVFDGALPDKKNQVKDLVRIQLDCPGLTLDDAQFKNFGHSAIHIMNATGSASQPIKLFRLSTETGDKARAAIYFDANQKVLPGYNDHIEVEECMFGGHDPAKAIQFREVKDGSVLGKDVRWPGR